MLVQYGHRFLLINDRFKMSATAQRNYTVPLEDFFLFYLLSEIALNGHNSFAVRLQ